MENGDKIPWSFQSWTSFVLFLIATWGIALVPASLVSKRPAGEPARSPEQSGEHRYESRLWQDPFEVLPAIQKIQKDQSNAECAPPSCLKAAHLSAASNGETLILAVFLQGEPYPEEVETRLRSRYAVVSALGSAGYTPDEGGDLRCFSLDSVPSGSFPFERFTHHGGVPSNQPYREKLNTLVACEWRDSKRDLPEYVVVVWVDERLFDETKIGSHPLVTLKRLAQQLTRNETNGLLDLIVPQWSDALRVLSCDRLESLVWLVGRLTKVAPDVRLAVIGPQTSDTLRALLSDKGDSSKDQGARGDVDRTRIYSFSSTVDALRETRDQTPFFQRHFKLIPVIGTDRQLAVALCEELKGRGVDPAKVPAKIALVAEWDTSYGRSMIEVFSNVFEGNRTARCSTAEPNPAGKVRCFTYLRGIDGRLPKGPAAESKEADKAGGQAKGVLPGGEMLVAPPQVQAFGRSQVDYIPRLVAQMKAQPDTRDYAAIGVLGSDFYDKVMLIEVLRHDFPEALIFTTDMDARYLDTDVQAATRNLLIGSHYGLALNKSLQGAIPAFRSVYQTSLFFGCLKALYDESKLARCELRLRWPHLRCLKALYDESKLTERRKGGSPASALSIEWKCPEDKNTLNPQPLVFEIGRSRAHPLTNPEPPNLHPESYRRSMELPSYQWAPLTILTLLGVVLGLALLPPLECNRFCFAVGVTSLFLVVLFGVIRLRVRDCPVLWQVLSLRPLVGFLVLWALSWPLSWLITHLGWAAQRDWHRNLVFPLTTLFMPIVALAVIDHARVDGKPFSLFEGVSNWPTILLRITAAAYCVFALIRGAQADKESASRLSRRYHLDNGQKAQESKKIDPTSLWENYCKSNRVCRVTGRVLGYGLLYLIFCYAMIWLLGVPNNPYRGPLNRAVNLTVLLTAISLTVGLLLTVFDATLLCNQLMKVLMEKEADWSDQAITEAADDLGIKPKLLSFRVNWGAEPVRISLEQYVDLAFLSECTEVVRRRVYDAAIPILLMFLARSPFFDQYHMSWSMILIFAVALAVVLACGALLRRSASEARRQGHEKIAQALENVRESHYQTRSDSGRRPSGDGGMPTPHEDAIRALERIDQGLDQITTGAFSKLKDDPFLHTLVVIVGGYGALQSLQRILPMLLSHGG
jgi:hypothetical protein